MVGSGRRNSGLGLVCSWHLSTEDYNSECEFKRIIWSSKTQTSFNIRNYDYNFSYRIRHRWVSNFCL